MARSMNSYCKGGSKVCRGFTDGSSVCLCTKGWSVFFATLNKHKWSDTSPRPKSVSETVVKKAIEETVQEFKEWYETKHKCSTVPIKRFEARKHVAPPKGKKILKPYPIHIMPKHMQTKEKCPCEDEVAEIVKWYDEKRKKKQ